MNPLLQELAEQAGFKVNWQHPDIQAIKMARFEKFAELIIRECAQFVEDKFDFCGDEIIAAQELRKHFGVEP